MTSHEYETILTELRSLRKRQNALLALVCVIVVWMSAITFAGDVHVALADRQQQPVQDWPFLYYVSLETLPADEQAEMSQVLNFAICSLNSRQVIEQQLPVQVAPTLYRVDTRALGWEQSLPRMIEQSYPYSRAPGLRSLVIRADWFCQFTLDQELSGQVYHELVFGKKLTTLDQFLAQLTAVPKSPHELGHIEGTSGVAVNRTRLVANIPTQTRQDVWQTFDFRELNQKSDPLEHLDRGFQHDASEIIGALPKSVAATGTLGALQVYALANAQGQLQNKAPADIVTDSTGVRGVEIRSAVSCISCHSEGLRPLKVNSLRRFIESGAEAYTDYKSREEIERFHLTNLQTLIDRHNADYAAILVAVNGLTPEQNSQAFQRVIRNYDAPVTLEQAAAELETTPEELKLALGYAGSLPARLAQLAEGETIARSSWEDVYRIAYYADQSWKGSTR